MYFLFLMFTNYKLEPKQLLGVENRTPFCFLRRYNFVLGNKVGTKKMSDRVLLVSSELELTMGIFQGHLLN